MGKGGYRHQTNQHILLHNIEYGPRGFTCKCGGTKFEGKREEMTMTGWKMARHFHVCLGCGRRYIFVGYK
jgi:hypothetical protein